MPTALPPDTTVGDVQDPAGHRWKAWVKGGTITVLTLVVVLGATGWLGVRSGTVSATGGGYGLSVEYPQVARAGLDVPWSVTVTAPESGFPDQIVLAVSSDWFELFESQGFSPEPSQETTDGRFDYLTLDTPATGDTLVFDFDTYVQPSAQLGEDAEVRLLVDGRQLTAVSYRTWVLP